MIQLAEFVNNLGSSDLRSLELCLEAYRENAFKVEIEDMGFNQNSGYIWLMLDNGVTIASCFATDVVYLATDWDSGEEQVFETYWECLNHVNNN
jgi:hypothetical protein